MICGTQSWGGQDAFYEYLWGQAGYIEVKTRQSEFLRLAQEIENTLDLPDPALKAEREELLASGLDLLKWKSTLRALNPNVGPRASGVNSSVSRRLGFLLYRNNILQGRIARLKEMTAQLSSRTQRLLRLRQYPYVDKVPECGEIDNIIRLKKFVDGVSEHGNELYKATQEGDGEPWFGNQGGGEVLRRTTGSARIGCVASPSRRR